MEKVSGFGGFFFRAQDPEGLAEWYRRHLGIDRVPGDYQTQPWQQEAGPCIFSPSGQVTDTSGAGERDFRLNFRVRDLDAMIAQLEGAGIEVKRDPESYPIGSFAWLDDPEGNPIELWQPA